MDEGEISHYRLGVSYDDINGCDAKNIWAYAVWHKWLPRVLAILAILLIGTTLFMGFRQNELIQRNKQLVQKLVENAMSGETLAELYQGILLSGVLSVSNPREK